MSAPQPAWDPEYPTPGALAYREGFKRGALERNLTAIPSDVLSWAIDRAIAAQVTSVRAGQVFADTYYAVQMQRKPRGGIHNPFAYLLAVYEKELRRK